MTEPPNPLDVIGPYLPLKVAQDKYDEDTYLLLSNDGSMQFDRDCSDRAALNAVASIINAAPAQAAAYDRLRADNAKLREALEWYEKQAAGCRKITSDGETARNALDRDGGARAARVLAETEPK